MIYCVNYICLFRKMFSINKSVMDLRDNNKNFERKGRKKRLKYEEFNS